jgi:hypothetical protein
MSNYLLISSTYRDRLLYPNPADFVIPFGTINNINQNTFNVFTTTNPITNSFPEFNSGWTNYFMPDKNIFETNILSGSSNKLIVDENVNTILLGIDRNPLPGEIIIFRQPLESCYDILRGFWIQIEIDGILYSRVIQGYEPTTRTVFLRNPFPFLSFDDIPIPCQIINTFQLTPDSPPSSRYVSINGDFLKDSPLIYFDSDIFIYNVNRNEFRKTIQFIEEFHKYELKNEFSPTSQITDQFMLFGNNISSYCGKVLFQENQSYFNFIPSSLLWYSRGLGYKQKMRVFLQMDLEENINDPNYFSTFEINEISYIGEITDIELKVIKIGKQEFFTGKQYKILPFDQSPIIQKAVIQIGSFSLGFQLEFKGTEVKPNPLSLLGNYFFPIIMSEQYLLGKDIIYFQPNSTITPVNRKNEPIDLSISQTTNGVTGIKSASILEDGSYLIITQQYNNIDKLKLLSKAKQENKIPDYCEGIDNFLILNFSSEGVVPLNYTGSQVTQSQMSCYELSVSSLILPNLILQTTSGLLTSSYPYLFLEISNETLPSGGNTDIIYSNNPNATKNTFICPTSDVNNPEFTKFVKIASAGNQIMKFSPYDNLRIRVSLPNGQTFTTERTDFLVPNEPNPRLQVTALIQITKLS